jgi:hypothetical protein
MKRRRTMSESTKRKISESHKGKKLSEEHRKKLSESHKGNPGRIFTDEEKQKYSEMRKGDKNPRFGKIVSEETRKKLSESHKGKIFSEEHKMKLSGENNHSWKGGINILNIPLYETYSLQLNPYEECRETKEGYLEVKCLYCDKWFIPKRNIVINRIQVIKGNYNGELRFYCSNECKKACPIYRQIKYPKGFRLATSREVQPELRKLVFERDDWTCQKCGSKENLHCHHYEGILINPIESADVDSCVTLCKKCHKEVHKQDNCKYSDLKCKGKNKNEKK